MYTTLKSVGLPTALINYIGDFNMPCRRDIDEDWMDVAAEIRSGSLPPAVLGHTVIDICREWKGTEKWIRQIDDILRFGDMVYILAGREGDDWRIISAFTGELNRLRRKLIDEGISHALLTKIETTLTTELKQLIRELRELSNRGGNGTDSLITRRCHRRSP